MMFFKKKETLELPFYKWDTIVKLGGARCDLSETGLLSAVKQITNLKSLDQMNDVHLIVSDMDAITAGRLAERFKIKSVVVLPNEIISGDAWCILTEFGNIYSFGA